MTRGSVTTAAVARAAGSRGTSRLRTVSQAAPPSTASMAGLHSDSGTKLREIPAAQVSATSSVSG